MKPDRLFEVSWEVCNKVGGINTVIKSKAALMTEHYSSYTMIGPYVEQKAKLELEQLPVPHVFKNVFAQLEQQGIHCYYGKWRTAGEPETILIDFQALRQKTYELKGSYWENFGIDSLNAQWEFEEPMLFSTAVGMLIHEYRNEHNEKVVGHFHEWMTGFTLLYLRICKSDVATVFTTHATMLGRAMAGSNEELYANLEKINPSEKAYQLGVQDKFTAERACAHAADVFTTVSEITALEAEKILGRKPEVLLFNGLSNQKFPTVEETSIKHAASREKIREFIAYYFFPYYSFDVQHTLTFFITARYEYRNKGLDIMTEALRRLNEYLKQHDPQRKIVVFYWIPLSTRGVVRSLIENKNAYFQIKNYVDWHGQSLLKQLTYDFLLYGTHENNPDFSHFQNLFTQDFLQDIRKDLMHFKREGNPPISTHEIIDQDTNQLYTGLMRAGLDNKEDDCVKSIIYPAYLDGADSLLNLPYYEAIVGAHLGLFPSYYEPWGYTPLESAALAVPAITTDLAGFGRFIQQNCLDDCKGIWVQPRFGKTWEEEVKSLFELMKRYAGFDHVERVENRLAAKTLAALADWKHFVKHYVRAHELALENAEKRKKQT